MSGITEPLTTAVADRYRIEKHLGEGGMATVYLAHDLKHDRSVALKVLRPELAAVIGAERFLNEIRLTANLQHPHILPLHDSGDADGFLFYVMPFVEDDTLRDKLDREKQLPVEEAVSITRSIASALDYAHRQGVIHRDIKPANILMHEGQPMIADFGIALAVSQASDQRLTETGLSIGTPHYMSPEQAMGDRELDPRSDVYSLGAMLYEMLAGEPPYTGSTAQAIVAKVITTKASPLRESRDTVPVHVETVVAKALQKSPADRFSSAATFAEALANPGFTVPTTAQVPAAEARGVPHGAGPSRRRAVLGAAAVLLGVGAFFAGRLTGPESERPVARFSLDVPEDVAVISACCGWQQTLSPDGRWLVYRGGGADRGRSPLYRRSLDRLEAEEIPGTDEASMPFFSPDGLWVGFWSGGRLRKAPMAGGPPVPISEIAIPDGAAWADNGLIVFTDDGQLYTVPAAGGTPSQVPHPDPSASYQHPSVLPGGEAAMARVTVEGEGMLAMVDLATGVADTLGYATAGVYAAGYLVMSGSDGTLLAQPFDPDARESTGQAVALLDGVRTAGPSLGEFTVSQSGDLVIQSAGPTQREQLFIQGREIEVVELPEPGNLEAPSFSPDGRRIAFRLANDGDQGVWIWDRDQLTQQLMVAEALFPVWDPAGEKISFSLDDSEGNLQPHWMPSDGSGAPEALFPVLFPEGAMVESWTPDGRAVVRVIREGQRDLGLMTPGDSVIQWLVEGEADDSHGQVSPDGAWLAYVSDRSGRQEVYAQALDGTGGRVPISAGGGHSPRWAPDGPTLYYAVAENEPLVHVALSVEGGVRVLSRSDGIEGIADLNPQAEVNYDVGPSGDEFVFIGSGGLGQGARPTFTWVLNWPEMARILGGGP